MAWKSDEEYDFFEDTRGKKNIARSAKNRRGHNGKGGPARFPSDYLTEKQLRAMDGECKTYRLGSPMNWDEFSSMPNDLKVMYIKKLRKQYNVPDEELAVSMGVDIQAFNRCIDKLKLSPRPAAGTDGYNWYATDDHGRFRTWWIIAEEEK